MQPSQLSSGHNGKRGVVRYSQVKRSTNAATASHDPSRQPYFRVRDTSLPSTSLDLQHVPSFGKDLPVDLVASGFKPLPSLISRGHAALRPKSLLPVSHPSKSS